MPLVVVEPLLLMLPSVEPEELPLVPFERLRDARELVVPLVDGSVLEFDMLEPVPDPLMLLPELDMPEPLEPDVPVLFEPIEPEDPVLDVPLPVEPAALPLEVVRPLLVAEPEEPMLLEPVPAVPPLVPGALMPDAPVLPLVPPVLVPADPLVPVDPLLLDPVWPTARVAPSARPSAAARVNSLGVLLMCLLPVQVRKK